MLGAVGVCVGGLGWVTHQGLATVNREQRTELAKG